MVPPETLELRIALPMTNIEGPPILDYLRVLAETKDQPPAEQVLRRCADHFDVSGIGVFCPRSSRCLALYVAPGTSLPDTFPWQTDANLGKSLYSQWTALAWEGAQDEWLLGLGWQPHDGEALLVWLYRPQKRGWKQNDPVLWPMVAQTLVRWLAQQELLQTRDERQCQKLEQMAQVTSRLSHDFGNYLTGILGFTELSLAQVPTTGLLHRYLQEVLQSARQGSEWIRRLHWFCRRNGHYSWPTELASVLEETQLRFTPETQLRWEKQLPPDLPLLAIDAISLQAALTEVISNAREATRGQGEVKFQARAVDLTGADCRALLGTAQPGKFVEITVRDNGPGIAPQTRERLFQDAFFSTKPRHRGLGLLVIYGILYRFQGGLRLDDGEGTGACVHLYVPAVAVESMTLTSQEAPHLLVVHPDPLLFESLRKILEWQGYRVSVALTAQSALSLYQTPGQSFALVLAEAMLPQLSGFDLARRILERDAKANFMFLYTQSAFHGLAEEELLKRFTLLRWPLDTDAFVQAVRATLARTSHLFESGKKLHATR